MAQIVLITGCSSGIGQESALFLAQDQQRRFKVYATMRNVDSRQDKLKTKAAESINDTLFIRELDVTKQESVDKTVKDIVDKEGRIDILVNNASIVSLTWWEESDSMNAFYEVMEVNYIGCVRLTKAVVPHMKEMRNGRILLISSVLGFKVNNAGIVSLTWWEESDSMNAFYEVMEVNYIGCVRMTKPVVPHMKEMRNGRILQISSVLGFKVFIFKKVSIIEPEYVLTPIVSAVSKAPAELFEYVAKLVPGDIGDVCLRMVTRDPSIVEGTDVQHPNDIAKLISGVIVSPKPDYRYQSSGTIKDMAPLRFVDATGNRAMDTWLKQ